MVGQTNDDGTDILDEVISHDQIKRDQMGKTFKEKCSEVTKAAKKDTGHHDSIVSMLQKMRKHATSNS